MKLFKEMLKKKHEIYSLKYNQSNKVVRFGKFGIKVLTFNRINETQLNSINRFLLYYIKKISSNKKKIKVWNFLRLNITLTKLNSESRMGKGKGNIYTKAIFLKPGVIIFEFSEITKPQILELFYHLKKRIPFKMSLLEKI